MRRPHPAAGRRGRGGGPPTARGTAGASTLRRDRVAWQYAAAPGLDSGPGSAGHRLAARTMAFPGAEGAVEKLAIPQLVILRAAKNLVILTGSRSFTAFRMT